MEGRRRMHEGGIGTGDDEMLLGCVRGAAASCSLV
jgi:hypothetical protein